MEQAMGATAAVSTPTSSVQTPAAGRSQIYEIAQADLKVKGFPNKDVGRGEVQGYGPDGKTMFKVKLIERRYSDGLGTNRFYVQGKALPVNITTLEAAKAEVRRQLKSGELLPIGVGSAVDIAKKPVQPTGKPAKPINFLASTSYAIAGGLSSYHLYRGSGKTRAEALKLLPAGIVRDAIAMAVNQLPLDELEPRMEVVVKGGIGIISTVVTNGVAAVAVKGSYPGHSFNAGMCLAAFNTSGALVGLKEFRARGYLGGKPADNPKDWNEWCKKFIPEGFAIGVGVASGIGPGALVDEAWKSHKAGTGISKGQWFNIRGAFFGAMILPMVQHLVSNALFNRPQDTGYQKIKSEAEKLFSRLKLEGVNAGSMVAFDKLMSMFKTDVKPGMVNPKFKLGKSTGWAAYLTLLGYSADVSSAGSRLSNIDNITDIKNARSALEAIDQMSNTGAPYLWSKITGSNSVPKEMSDLRELIYSFHPSLRPSAK
jgi:hypothetical protein